MPSPITTAAVLAGLCGLTVVSTGAFAADPGPQDPVQSCCSGASSKAVLLTNNVRLESPFGGGPAGTPTFTRVATSGPFGQAPAQQPAPARVVLLQGQPQVEGWLELPQSVSSEDEIDNLRDRLENSLESQLEELERLQEQLEDEGERIEELYEELFEDLEDLAEEFEDVTEEMQEQDAFQVVVRGLTTGDADQRVHFSSRDSGVFVNRVRLIDDCKECGTCDEECCAACEGCGDEGCEVETEELRFAPGGAQNLWFGDLEGMLEIEGLGEDFAIDLVDGFGEEAVLWTGVDGGQVRWLQTDDCKECEDCRECGENGQCESCEDCGDEDCDAEVEEEFVLDRLSFGDEPVLLKWSSTPPVNPLQSVTTNVTRIADDACGPHCELEAEVRQMREDLNALRDLLTPRVN